MKPSDKMKEMLGVNKRSRVEFEVQCVSCGFKGEFSKIVLRHQVEVPYEWKCPKCQTLKKGTQSFKHPQ